MSKYRRLRKKNQSKNLSKEIWVGMIAFFIPLPIYIALTVFIVPSPNSSFILLGIVGSLFIGIGLVSVSGLIFKTYFGHTLTAGFLGVGIGFVAISAFIMYIPSIYEKIDEQYMGFYFLIWIALFISAIWYVLFRMAIVRKMRDRGLSKSKIKELTKNVSTNWWWYDKLHEAYNIGILYPLNKVFTIVYSIVLIVQLFIGWLKPFGIIIAIGTCLMCIINSAMWLVVCSELGKDGSTHGKNSLGAIGGFLFPIFFGIAIVNYYLKVVM